VATNPLDRIEQFARKKKTAARNRENRRAQDNDQVEARVFQFEKSSAPNGRMFTGAGDDGVVQPYMPTGTLQTPNGQAMVHEGEQIKSNGNGTVDVIPYQEGNQQELAQQDYSQGGAQDVMFGFRSGGRGIRTGYAEGGENIAVGETANPLDVLGTDIPNATDTTTSPNIMLGDGINTSLTQPSPNVQVNQDIADPMDMATPTANATEAQTPTYDPSKFLETTAKGKNPYVSDVLTKAVGDVEDVNRQNLMYGAQKMGSNPNLTTGAQNAMQAQMASDASASRADALTKAAGVQSQQMYGANKDLMAENARQDALAKQNSELADNYYQKAKDLYTRMKVAGFGDDEIFENAEYKDLMGQFYKLRDIEGTETTKPFEDSMATTQSEFGLIDNKAQFEDNAIAIMESLRGRDVKLNDDGSLPDEILSDDTLLQNAANYLGLWDPYTTQFKLDENGHKVRGSDGNYLEEQVLNPKVADWIKSTYGVKTKSDTTIAADYIWDEFVADNPELTDNPEIRGMVDDWVKGNTGAGGFTVDEDGNVTLPENFQLPWDDPYKKYGEFETVDGGEVVFADDGTKSVVVDGKTVPYDSTIGDSEYSYQKFDEAWDKVLDSEKDLYLDTEGNFDMDKLDALMKYGSVDTFPADGSFSDFTKYFDTGDVWQNDILAGNGNIGNTTPEGVDEGVPDGEGRHFWYQDKDGDWQNYSADSPAFRKIWLTASTDAGRALDSDEFGDWFESKDNPSLDKDGNIIEPAFGKN